MAKLASKAYGDALFELAVEENRMDELLAEAHAVVQAFHDNEDLLKLLNHPKVDKSEKEKVISDIFSQFVSKDMTGLLVLMVSKTRHNDMIATMNYFEQRVKEYKNIGTAYVTTAAPLSDAQKEKVVNKLLATTRYVEFEMNYQVDTSIIGGMIIRIGDRVVDSSIRSKLDSLKKDLEQIQLSEQTA